MIEKYKKNVMYLFKNTGSNTWETEGIPFYCNKSLVKKNIFNPMDNTYKSVQVEVIKTTTQINFSQFDKVSKYKEPTVDEFSIIQSIDKKPYMEQGNKYRKTEYWERTIEIS